ncbi:hypothetical protein EC991_003819 [Linnemannia zychae]|nr:hypothetical protein EC991_003819 [Linnemannia zychae]
MANFLQCAEAGALRKNAAYIESLRLQSLHRAFLQFLEYCPTTFPRLTTLDIEGLFISSEEPLSDIMSRCTAGLKAVSLSVCDEYEAAFVLGSDLVEALSKHSNTIEILRFTGEITHRSEHLNTLLCTTPNLKELYFPGNTSVSYGGRLRASDIVQSEWACTNLKVFACQIVSINRPGLTDECHFVDSDGSVTQGGTVQESIDLQRSVYTHLARLKSLQELQLGFIFDEFSTYTGYEEECSTHFQQWDCLAMTLESGLDLLKDLKELRIVRLHNMTVGIDQYAEQEWVKKNWPHAKIESVDETYD